MPTIQELRQVRLEKLNAIRKAGIDPFPAKTHRTHDIGEALSQFNALSRAKKKIIIAGRIRALRGHGGATFADCEDNSSKIQVILKQDALGDKKYKFFLDYIDLGDIVEMSGVLFKTKRGEKTMEVKSYVLLAKSLLPLPEKWHGLQDVEERYRKRYLDLLMNPEAKTLFLKRSEIVRKMREFLEKHDYIEVETPILQTMAGGATAKPFETYLNALKMPLYLRVAPELYLKRLLVGGFEKIYEIGRCFRNEGMDWSHNPDFTMLECYTAWMDYEKLMKFIEKLFQHIDKKKFKPPFKRVEYGAIIKEGGDDRAAFANLKVPTFVINHPVSISPLAKKLDAKRTARFQLIIEGREVVNGFSELNDPIDQRSRFIEQEKMRERGDEEAQRLDEDFIEAMEYGMPPAAGFGIGIDRLVALLTNSHALREVILFPTMRIKP
ncbi:MAG: amino acid--tRNA ligase-related protein [Patescibacteria group bacterium]